MSEPTFRKEDVWKIARAVVDNPISLHERGYRDYLGCYYCSATLGYSYPREREGANQYAEFKHELDCPVLTAQDLLVGTRP